VQVQQETDAATTVARTAALVFARTVVVSSMRAWAMRPLAVVVVVVVPGVLEVVVLAALDRRATTAGGREVVVVQIQAQVRIQAQA
ncbi:hypothetical protein CH063_15510, partial [Colletotrichum higginsianum]